MNKAKALTKYVRISPRKARRAADLIRGLNVSEALKQLTFCNLKGGRLLQKTLESAIANGENNLDMRRDSMKIHEVRVDEGPTLKRAKPRSRGSRHPIMKRTSHFTVIVAEGEGV